MTAEIFRYLSSILNMALHPERHRLNPLEQQKTIKGGQCGAGISLANCATPCDIRGCAKLLRVDHPVIRRLWLIQHVKAYGMLAPQKFSAIHNYSAQRCAMPSHEFRHGVHYHVRAVFDWSQ